MTIVTEHAREVSQPVLPESSIPLIFFRNGSELRSLRTAEDFAEVLSQKRGKIREGYGRLFLQAFECLRRADRYWAADGFYRWLKSGGHLDNRIMISRDDHKPSSFLWPRRHYAGVELLLNLFRSTSHKLFREVTAQALSRFYALRGDYERAKQILEEVVVKHGWPHHYKIDNALYTIDRKIKGRHIPPYLERYLGDDNDHLLERSCLAPYTQYNVDPEGGVMVCCGEWLRDVKIGNLYHAKSEQIINSDTAKAVRKSVVDGSFQYCDELKCPLITGQCLPKKSEISHAAVRAGIDLGHFDIAGPAEIILAMDRTCNLTCPSCRTQMISDKEEERDRKTAIVEESIIPLLPTANQIYLNLAGEIWASKSSRALLKRLNRTEFPNLKVLLISNGMLFTKAEWDSFPNIHDMVLSIRISIDAATKESFETIRRGGRWEPFLENMEFISSLMKTGVIPSFSISFTYQAGNYQEMPDFVRLGKGWGVTRINFEKLEDHGTYAGEGYKQLAVHKSDHPEHQKFLEVLKDPILTDKVVFPDYKHFLE